MADHDTIVTFRREKKAAIEAAFQQVLLLAKETGLLKVGNVSIDGAKIDANASRAKSLRYDRAKELRERIESGDCRAVDWGVIFWCCGPSLRISHCSCRQR